MSKNSSALHDGLRMALSLFLICAVTAGVVAFVNTLTVDKIAENLEGEIRSSIEGMFGEGVDYTTLDDIPAEADAIYSITRGDEQFYCVNLNSAGFGGDIGMLVSIDVSGKIVGVRVVSHSETPGLGSRAAEEKYLSGFDGVASAYDVDSIAGATISSNAVKSGVIAAKQLLKDAGLITAAYSQDGGD